MATSKKSAAAPKATGSSHPKTKQASWLHRVLGHPRSKLVVFVTAFASVGVASLIYSFAATPATTYQIKWGGAGNVCLDDHGGVVAYRNPIEVWTCNSSSAQQWTLPGDGTIHLGSSAYCLDVKYSGKTAGTPVWLWHCNGTGAQQWVVGQNGTLKNPQSQLCLDNKYRGTANGNQVWMWTCNNTVAQVWSWSKIASPAPTPTPSPTPAPTPTPTPSPSGSATKPYYVDCTGGSDNNAGTSETAAWKTLGKASKASIAAGSGILLKRGCVFDNQSLTVKSSGKSGSAILIGAYGSGALPVIKRHTDGADIDVTGSYVNIDSVALDAVASGHVASSSKKCAGQATGYIVGVLYHGGAQHDYLRNSTATHLYAGVYIDQDASWNHILGNNLSGNTMMQPDDATANNDAGAFGVLLWGDHNEVANNQIDNNRACSFDYGTDGSAIEVYTGQNNNIHHNHGHNDDGFTELGGKGATGNIYAYNTYSASIGSSFLVTRGAGDKSDGPVANTILYNNTVYLPVSGSGGVVCYAGCTTGILTMRNNILFVNGQSLYVEGTYTESNNIYWRPGGNPDVQAKISASSKKADPKFTNAGSGNFHLLSGSPAINTGSSASVSAGYATDTDGTKVPTGSAPDMGAYEFH